MAPIPICRPCDRLLRLAMRSSREHRAQGLHDRVLGGPPQLDVKWKARDRVTAARGSAPTTPSARLNVPSHVRFSESKAWAKKPRTAPGRWVNQVPSGASPRGVTSTPQPRGTPEVVTEELIHAPRSLRAATSG